MPDELPLAVRQQIAEYEVDELRDFARSEASLLLRYHRAVSALLASRFEHVHVQGKRHNEWAKAPEFVSLLQALVAMHTEVALAVTEDVDL